MESETVKLILEADSPEVVISAIEIEGGSSSSMIVSTAEESVIVALVALERVIVAVSLTSSIESSQT